jgi:hypothetical protein
MSGAAVAKSPVAAEPAPKAEPETWRSLGAVAAEIVADLGRVRAKTATELGRRNLVAMWLPNHISRRRDNA